VAGQRTRIFGWCEPSACCRKHDGTQPTGSLHCRRFKIGRPTGRANRSRTCRQVKGAQTASRRRPPRPDLRVSYDRVGDRPTRNCPGAGARTGRLTCPDATDGPPHPGWRSTPPSTSRRMTRGEMWSGRRFRGDTHAQTCKECWRQRLLLTRLSRTGDQTPDLAGLAGQTLDPGCANGPRWTRRTPGTDYGGWGSNPSERTSERAQVSGLFGPWSNQLWIFVQQQSAAVPRAASGNVRLVDHLV